MKVLLVGGGGREHALAWKLGRDDPSLELIAAPGNPGIASLGRCVPIAADDVQTLLHLARAESVDLCIVGPEAPLALGIVDRFRDAGIPIFGPTQAAAAIETSKAFAKELMRNAGIATARAERYTVADDAWRAARRFGAPVVIKATGLAAGKGVVVCDQLDEARRAIDDMLRDGALGPAGAEILVEEYMEGEEISVFALTDGEVALPMLAAQDHKRLLDGDRGPNTGGMGAYAPVAIAGRALIDDAVSRIFLPTLAALRDRGAPFTGLLYAGLMLTAHGPKVVEFNCRFGDPETEAILPLMMSDLIEPMSIIARGESIAGARLAWSAQHAVTTVVAASGYPAAPRRGDRVSLPPAATDVHIFHAGTALDREGRLVTEGGRVFAVTAIADSFAEAQRASAEAAGEIGFAGKHCRSDIGWRESARHARIAGN